MDIMATEQYIVEDTLDQEIEQIANEIASELDDEVVVEASTESPNKTGGSDAGEAPEQPQVGKTKELKGNKLTKKKVKAEVKTKGQGEDPAEVEVYEQDEDDNGKKDNPFAKFAKKGKNGKKKNDDDEDEDKLINDVKIEIHYAKNKYFIKENQIIENIKKIPNIPIMIVHGRSDITCLPESSFVKKDIGLLTISILIIYPPCTGGMNATSSPSFNSTPLGTYF